MPQAAEGRERQGLNQTREQSEGDVQPLITVITPCLNAIDTISDTLSSVAEARAELLKRGQDLEHIIVEGGSRDGSDALIKAHAAGHVFCRVIGEVSGGPYAAMNAGLAKANGRYSHFLNADDFLLEPESWALFIIKGLQEEASILLASIGYFRRPCLKLHTQWLVPPLPADTLVWRHELLHGLHYPHPGFIAITTLYLTIGFDEQYKLSADYKLMQSLLLLPKMHNKVLTSQTVLVAMAEGGATGGWRAILQGYQQLKVINQELGIHAPAWRRYLRKLATRMIAPTISRLLPAAFHLKR